MISSHFFVLQPHEAPGQAQGQTAEADTPDRLRRADRDLRERLAAERDAQRADARALLDRRGDRGGQGERIRGLAALRGEQAFGPVIPERDRVLPPEGDRQGGQRLLRAQRDQTEGGEGVVEQGLGVAVAQCMTTAMYSTPALSAEAERQ